MLSYTHSCLHYVHHVVAELLALLDDIHVHRADGISVEVVVHIVDVLALQLVAIIVDLVLDVEGEVGIVVAIVSHEGDVHLGERLVGQLHHLVHVLVLSRDEVLLALDAAVDGAGDIVAAVTDTLYLGNLTEHGTNLCLRLIAQVRVAHLVEILRNLNLHIVGDTLVLLDASVEFDELILVSLAKQLLHHAKHTLDAFCLLYTSPSPGDI